ncbi:MAG: DNA polymerase III subunit gamma/tau, partial [Clostridiales bacterium]|nr:DNA polymerase III subunit gamma/tau [Clostridiales bacterium]
AASNNGVDNIRQIREEVEYRPATGKYKVYIIDEVHMLSPGAFNALLKTLEEPPEYVIFVLATTEVHKIPITILSRCQRYDFHRISTDTIEAWLSELMARENVEVEEKALRYVAKTGDGSMRDALSLLDQCIAFHLGEKLRYDDVLEVLGATDTEVFSRLLRLIIAKDVAGAVRLIGEIVDDGREIAQLTNDFIWYLRNLMLMQGSDDMEDVLDMSSDNLAALREEAGMVSQDVLIRYIQTLSELSGQLRSATQKRVLLEIAVIKLCRPQMEKDYSSLVDRMDSIEKRMESGVVVSPQPQASAQVQQVKADAAAPVQQAQAVAEKPKLPKAVPDDIKKIMKSWKSLVGGAGGITRLYLEKAVPSLGKGGELMLVLDDREAFLYLDEDRAGGMSAFRESIAQRTGCEVEIILSLNQGDRTAKETVPDLTELINFEVDEEDFE